MPNLDDRYYEEEVGYVDMAEAPRRVRESNARQIAIAALITLSVLVLAVLLIRGSLPAMTPQEIVQRDDYQGQQPARHIFNLYSLRQDKLRLQNEKNQLNKQLVKNAALSSDAPGDTQVASGTTLSVMKGEQGDIELTKETVVADQVAEEIPAKTKLPSARVYEKSELRRETALPVVSNIVRSTGAVSSQQLVSQAAVVTVLPVYTISADDTNLRSGPSLDSVVLKTLDKGQTITVFDSGDVWAQVATNDGLGTTGFVHNSLLEVADIEK